jgi:two-component system, response regulator, stage 0 sporulation protein F
VLQAEGFSVRRARSGRIALHVLAEWTPDVILVDLDMPDWDAWTFYHECRRRGFHGPIVLICGYEVREALQELGAQAVLEKPFNIDDLLDVVQELAPVA